MQTAVRNSYRLDKCLYEPLTISISCSFNCIRAFEKELKAIDHAILETNAVFSQDSIRPVAAGEAIEEVCELLMPHIENHERIYKAAVTCDRALVVEVFLHDPIVKGHHCSPKDIAALVDDMIDNTMTYLPEGWK